LFHFTLLSGFLAHPPYIVMFTLTIVTHFGEGIQLTYAPSFPQSTERP